MCICANSGHRSRRRGNSLVSERAARLGFEFREVRTHGGGQRVRQRHEPRIALAVPGNFGIAIDALAERGQTLGGERHGLAMNFECRPHLARFTEQRLGDGLLLETWPHPYRLVGPQGDLPGLDYLYEVRVDARRGEALVVSDERA